MKRPVVITLLIVALAFVCAGVLAVAFFAFGQPEIQFVRNVEVATAEESKTLNVDGPFTLKVQDDAGNVSIVGGGEDDKVTVKVVKTGIAGTQKRAEEDLKNIKYEIKQQGDVITLTYDLEEVDLRRDPGSVDTVDFIVAVPTHVTVDVHSAFGNVELDDLTGAVNVKTESGHVEATSINARSEDIRLESSFGSISLADASAANITLKSNSGALEARNVRASKDVELFTEFGNVNFDNGSAGSLTISTNSGAVDLESVNVSGALVVEDEFGNINLEKVKAKSYDTQTNSGSIVVDGMQGSLKAHTGFGNITVKNAENATLDLNTESGAIDFEGSLGEGPHNINSNFGEIEVSIPTDSALNVDFQTDFGRVRSDIPITVTLSGDQDQTRQVGTINGGGSEFNVSTNSGSITIKVLGE
jgi:DUF4097 and DUF4098 domain-containing protein YvlB